MQVDHLADEQRAARAPQQVHHRGLQVTERAGSARQRHRAPPEVGTICLLPCTDRNPRCVQRRGTPVQDRRRGYTARRAARLRFAVAPRAARGRRWRARSAIGRAVSPPARWTCRASSTTPATWRPSCRPASWSSRVCWPAQIRLSPASSAAAVRLVKRAGHPRVGRRGDRHRLLRAVEGASARSPPPRSARCARPGRTGRRRSGSAGSSAGVAGVVDRGDRTPDVVGVLRVVQRDRRVGQRQVQRRERGGRLGQARRGGPWRPAGRPGSRCSRPAPLQNFPATVWSGVRMVLESRPSSRTSASAAAYAGLLDRGRGGRPELLRAVEHERRDRAPAGVHRRGELGGVGR